jgi:predicted NBD/HSP70 family sugar kinase
MANDMIDEESDSLPRRPAAGDSRMSLLRELGEQAVLQAIFRQGPITRPEIASGTGLSKPTVSSAVSRLEQAGLVRTSGIRPGQRGRKPLAFVVSDRAGYVIGADIGGTNLRVATCDLFGEPIHVVHQLTTKDGSRAVGAQILEMVSAAIDRTGSDYGRPLALGISVPGVVDRSTGRVTSLAHNVAPEGGFDPLAVIRGRFDLPVLVENNVNLAAVGEKWFGLARGVSTMAFIAVGAGVGMGIVIDDELVRGAHGAAGEIAFLPLVGDPFDPRHRLHGGLEDEVAAAGILAAYAAGRRPSAPEASSVHEVFELAAGGDRAAREVVQHVAARLGAAIATVCAILDPGLVVLGGGIGANPLLLRPVRGAAAALAPITARIETTMLGDRAAVQGALAIALQAAREVLLSQGTSGERRGTVRALRQGNS